MGAVLFAVTQSLISMLFMLMMPLFIVGHYVDQKLQAKRERKEQLKQFREAMAAFRQDITELQRVERAVRLAGGAVRQRHRRLHLQARPAAVDPPARAPGVPGRSGSGSARCRRGFRSRSRTRGNRNGVPARNRGLPGPVPGDRRRARRFPAAVRRLVRPRRAARAGRRRGPGHGAAARRPALAGRGRGGSHHLRPVPGTLELAAVAAARRVEPQPAQPATTLRPAPPAASACWPGWRTSWNSAKPPSQSPGPAHRPGIHEETADVPAPVLPSVLVIVEDDAPVDRGRLTRLVERGPDCRRARPVGGHRRRGPSGRVPRLHGGRRRTRHHDRPGHGWDATPTP